MDVARVGEDTVTSAEMPGAPEGGGYPKGKGRYDVSAQGSMAEGGGLARGRAGEEGATHAKKAAPLSAEAPFWK